NRISIVIPCHRICASNGDLVGYGGGRARKQWLLGHEQRPAGIHPQQALWPLSELEHACANKQDTHAVFASCIDRATRSSYSMCGTRDRRKSSPKRVRRRSQPAVGPLPPHTASRTERRFP